MPNVLGQCFDCKGPLLVRGGQVHCARAGCGKPQLDHPLTKEMAAHREGEKAEPRANEPVSPIAYQPDWVDRLTALERLVKAQQLTLGVLQQQVAELKAQLGGKPAGHRKSA